MKSHDALNAISKYKSAVSKLDTSIVCKTYENDLIFIIAINNDKYEQYNKEINRISFEIHSQFDLEKEIVCMPNKFVSKWDTPLFYMRDFYMRDYADAPNKFVSKWDTPLSKFCLSFDSRLDLDAPNKFVSKWDTKIETHSDGLDNSLCFSNDNREKYEPQQQGVTNGFSKAA